MAVTDQQVYNEIQYHLLETPNNGASYGSGLYTTAEVVARTNYRLNLFNKLTNINTTLNVTQAVTANTKSQDVSSLASDLIDLLEVSLIPASGDTLVSPVKYRL